LLRRTTDVAVPSSISKKPLVSSPCLPLSPRAFFLTDDVRKRLPAELRRGPSLSGQRAAAPENRPGDHLSLNARSHRIHREWPGLEYTSSVHEHSVDQAHRLCQHATQAVHCEPATQEPQPVATCKRRPSQPGCFAKETL